MYGTLSYLSYLWDLKEQKRREDALKSSFGVAMQVIGRVGEAIGKTKSAS